MVLWGLYMVSDKRKKLAEKAYEPYFEEAIYCLENYIIACLAVIILFILCSFVFAVNMWPLITLALGILTILECLGNFRLSFLAKLENRRLLWIKRNLTIIKITEDFSTSTRWGSILPKLYPKNQRMNRYKLICVDQNQKRYKLRSAMSGKKYQIIQDRLFELKNTSCEIHYGKYSHIIMLYKNHEEWTDKLNHMI